MNCISYSFGNGHNFFDTLKLTSTEELTERTTEKGFVGVWKEQRGRCF